MKNNTKIMSVTRKVKMKKIHCVICGKYRKFKNPKISYILKKAIISNKCENEDEKTFKEQE